MIARTIWLGILGIAAVIATLEYTRPAKTAPTNEPQAVATSETIKGSIVKKPIPAATLAPEPEVKETEVLPDLQIEEAPIVEQQTEAPSPPEPLADEAPLLLTGMDSTRETAAQRDKELLEKVVTNGAWDAYRTLLAESVQAGLASLREGPGLTRFDSVWQQPLLYRALLRWKTLGRLPESTITRHVKDPYTARFLIWLLNNNEAMEEFLLTVHPSDDPDYLLKFVMDAWAVNEEKFEKYYPLALACAVVFDRPVRIPNPIGPHEYDRANTVDPLERYNWYVRRNEAGKLASPVHHLSARDLVWVVCAPVNTSELDWAIGNVHVRRNNWGRTYGMIEYLMERAVEGFNPYKEYSFAEILKHGGICGDQSYFCVNTARAQGIPAMIIGGETDSGPHAWAGVKVDDRKWDTGIGRIGGSSKGQAENPQTGGSITEQEILHWNERSLQSPAITLKVWRHLWLADFFEDVREEEKQRDSVRLANRIGTSFTETWQALYKVLQGETELTGEPPAPGNLDDWKSFAAAVRREFKDNPRMAGIAARAESEYIWPYVEEGDARRGLLRERRRIDRDAGEQADLLATSLKREADLIHKRGGTDAKRDIARLYTRGLRDYGSSITAFKIMAADYFQFMRGDPTSARAAARDIELAFKRMIETGTKDWFRANTESDIYRMICGYYRAAGDSRRADMLEKRLEVLLRRAKRSAL